MRYRVGRIFLPARLSDSSKSYLETSWSSDFVVPENLNENKCFNLEANCHLCLFPPSAEFLSAKDENDLSMVLHFACDSLSLVAAGDAGEKRERQLLSLDFNWHAQVFKASHHGSASANSEEFLRAVSPLAMIFSVGASNKYKHPAVEIIERARRLGIKMWRTDQMGSILLYANNRQLFFKSGGF